MTSATPNEKNEKRKRNEHFRASWKGLMVKKSFRSFQKRQFEKRIFNQYYEYHKFVENQLNFKPILETKSAPFRTVRMNRTTILGNQSTWDKSRVMHRRHFNRLFSAKKRVVLNEQQVSNGTISFLELTQPSRKFLFLELNQPSRKFPFFF